MKIVGNIQNQDYINCFPFTKLKASVILSLWGFISGAVIFSVSLVIGIVLGGDDGLFIASVVAINVIVMGIVFMSLKMKIWIWEFSRKAELNNIGIGTYELQESCLQFSGTMHSCVIPYSVIKCIRFNNGTRYLEFGNFAGFIIPKVIVEGDVDEFMIVLKQKIGISSNKSLTTSP